MRLEKWTGEKEWGKAGKGGLDQEIKGKVGEDPAKSQKNFYFSFENYQIIQTC